MVKKKSNKAKLDAGDVTIKNPEPLPSMVPAKKEKSLTIYKIDMQAPEYCGEFKMVDFVDGVGHFSMDIFKAKKPGWFDRKTGEQIKGVPFGEYLKLWKDRGAIVTPVKKKPSVNTAKD